MERQRRSRKLDNPVKGHHSEDYKRSRHDMPANNEEHRASRDAAKTQRAGSQKKEKADFSLAVENDHVRQWLAKINTEANEDTGKSTLRQIEPDYGHRTHRQQPEFRSLRHAAEVTTESGEPSKRKRRHNSCSDSSLLENAIRAKPPWTRDDRDRDNRRESSSRPYKRSKVDSLDTKSSAHASTPRRRHDVTYEKRARRKTREDRYEPKTKGRKSSSGDQVKQTSTNTKKRISHRKAVKKTGEDLWQNFSSTSIGQDRLTIRQSHGLGLFKNGRASSPVRYRGLPDLSFSEMGSLQHSNLRGFAAKEDRNTSNSREKGNRKAAKVCEEISTFFKPTKTPLKVANSNARERKPPADVTGEPCANRKERVTDWHLAGRTSSESVTFPEKSFVGFGRNSPSSERISAARCHNPSTRYVKNGLDAMSRQSGEVTTYVTWSETPFSPGATIDSGPLRNVNQSQVSLTPESIRRRIEDTGIFRDTCTERTLALAQSGAGRIFGTDASNQRHYSTDLHAGTTNRSSLAEIRNSGERFSMASPSSSQSCSRKLDQTPGHSRLMGHIQKPEDIEKLLERRSLDDRGVGTDKFHSTAPNHVVKNIRDRESDCCQNKESRRPKICSPTESLSAKALIKEKISPGTRKKLAGSARIKYNSSTPAVNATTEKDTREERKEEVSEKRHAQSHETFVENSTVDVHPFVEEVPQGLKTAIFRPNIPDATEKNLLGGDAGVEEEPVIHEIIQLSNNPHIKIGGTKRATASPLLTQQKDGKVDEAPSSKNHTETANLAPFRTDSAHLNDLPVGKSWITHGLEAAPQFTSSITLVERESSIIPQENLQQNRLEQFSMNYPDNVANGRFGEEFGGPKSDTQLYIDEIEQQMGINMEIYYDVLAEDDEYIDNLLHQDVDELEMDARGQAADVEMWQARDQVDLAEIERYDSGSRSIQGHHQVNYDIYSGAYFVPYGLAGQGAMGYNDEINDQMQGFWRPRRQY